MNKPTTIEQLLQSKREGYGHSITHSMATKGGRTVLTTQCSCGDVTSSYYEKQNPDSWYVPQHVALADRHIWEKSPPKKKAS